MKSSYPLIAFATLFLSNHAYSEVPHTFVPGAPAKANDVNENFNYLNSQVNTYLETLNTNNSTTQQNITDIQTNIKHIQATHEQALIKVHEDTKVLNAQQEQDLQKVVSNLCPEQGYKYSYDKKSSSVGTKVILGDTEYVVGKIPFRNVVSGKKYVLTTLLFSLEKEEDEALYMDVYPNRKLNCAKYAIQGGDLQISESIHTFIRYDVYSIPDILRAKSYSSYGASLSIQIEDAYISIPSFYLSDPHFDEEIPRPDNLNDLTVATADFPFEETLTLDEYRTLLDQYIDYIKIEEEF